jgi:DNA-binding beta-propeller fold protein YncE
MRGMAVDPSGATYVADLDLNRVQKFDASGALLTQWGGSGSGPGQFNACYGVAIDPATSNVFVTDANNNRVQVFDSSGNYLRQFGNGLFTPAPTGIAIDTAGNVYVGDYYANRVLRFTTAGGYVGSFGSAGSGNGQMSGPQMLAVDSAGNVYVADENLRIDKFDATSANAFVADWGSSGTGDGQFAKVFGVTVDSANNVYATDTSNNRIEKFDSNGNYLAQFGSPGSGPGQFSNPFCVGTDGAGKIYVADDSNMRVEVFNGCTSDVHPTRLVRAPASGASSSEADGKGPKSGPLAALLSLQKPVIAYPNPAGRVAKVGYYLPSPSQVRLALLTLGGQNVAVLNLGDQPAGIGTASFDLGHLASGIYFVILETNSGSGWTGKGIFKLSVLK